MVTNPDKIEPSPRLLAGILAFTASVLMAPFVSTRPPEIVWQSGGGDPITLKWCDRAGWAMMTDDQCQALKTDGAIPLPALGTCPGAYVAWTYRAGRPPICVKRA